MKKKTKVSIILIILIIVLIASTIIINININKNQNTNADVRQTEQISNIETTSDIIEDKWTEAAKDYMLNINKYASPEKIIISSEYEYQLLDMNNDHIPEIFTVFISGAGGSKYYSSCAVFDGEKYNVSYIDENRTSNYIKAYKNIETGKNEFWSGFFNEDSFDDSLEEGIYTGLTFWREYLYQDKWSITDNKINIDEIINNTIDDHYLSLDDNTKPRNIREKERVYFKNLTNKLYEKYTIDTSITNTIIDMGINCDEYLFLKPVKDFFKSEEYKEKFTDENISKAIDAYINGSENVTF